MKNKITTKQKKIISIIQSIKKIKKIDIKDKLRQDLNFDSFDLARLTVVLEETYGVDIFKSKHPETVNDILKKLK